jgi:hypothetical protein
MKRLSVTESMKSWPLTTIGLEAATAVASAPIAAMLFVNWDVVSFYSLFNARGIFATHRLHLEPLRLRVL